ncbi:hypothetical protein GJ744_003256 [Endocarpon pusillum]|uniref:Enoyl reductase (ER) domain-containing protein n=1 Tax=Endocarpon pusillum TaxID=364733 RepID=A0A8H7DZZ2_9EURO|nr:hypothetical protein GJ744_003256 [Endocarpon pusillum]
MPLPEHMSTAYYALHYVARITDGETILIHSGAGGTGQAAIQIASKNVTGGTGDVANQPSCSSPFENENRIGKKRVHLDRL